MYSFFLKSRYLFQMLFTLVSYSEMLNILKLIRSVKAFVSFRRTSFKDRLQYFVVLAPSYTQLLLFSYFLREATFEVMADKCLELKITYIYSSLIIYLVFFLSTVIYCIKLLEKTETIITINIIVLLVAIVSRFRTAPYRNQIIAKPFNFI